MTVTPEMFLSGLFAAEKIVFYITEALTLTVNTKGMTDEERIKTLDDLRQRWPKFNFDSPVED